VPADAVLDDVVGRRTETAALDAFRRTAARHGGVLMLGGEPGVGKSRLLALTAERAAREGGEVLHAAGAEFEADLPYAALHLLLGPLVDVLPELELRRRDALAAALGLGGGPSPDRAAVADATVDLLARRAAARPLLLCLDDLHWFDRSSASVLSTVARRLDGTRVGLLAAVRTGTESFFDGTGLPRLDLAPLAEEDARTLLDRRGPGLAPAVAARLVAEAQGNPLALLELPDALTAAQRAARAPLPAVLPLTTRIEEVFAGRVEDLSPAAGDLLLLAALEGSGNRDVLHRAWSTLAADGSAGVDGLDGLVGLLRDRALVHVDRDRVTFRHPLVRSAVVRRSVRDGRRRAHAALAAALADDPDRHAWHRAGAVNGPDERVAELLDAAARRRTRRGDPEGAVEALLRAADLSADPDARSRRLAEAAYLGVGVVGDLHGASDLLAEAQLRNADPSTSLHAATAAALLLLQGDTHVRTPFRLLLHTVRDRVDDVDVRDPALVTALSTLVDLAQYGAHPDLWEPLVALLTRLAPESSRERHLLVGAVADPAALAPPVLRELEDAVAGLDGGTDPQRLVRVTVAAFAVDRFERCREPLWQLVHRAREGTGMVAGLSASMQLCIDDVLTGRWDEAEELADEGRALAERLGYQLAAWPFEVHRAAIAAVRGDHEAALEVTGRIVGWATPRGAHAALRLCRWVRGLVASGARDGERAYRELTALGPPDRVRWNPWAHWTALDLVEAAARAGRRDEATAHVRALRDARVAAVSPRAALLVTAAAAVVAPEERADALFERALAVPGTERWRFERARVELARGEHLRRSRAVGRARGHLSAAHDAFAALGARTWAERAAAELRAAGGGRPDVPDRDPDPAGLLTPQERLVAELAAEGLTNRQIADRLLISRRTVGIHLYRVFPKLGITSRAALRDAREGPAQVSGRFSVQDAVRR
jgi:DNA-binding CsgD family transcriptional regulator